jgi:hypothetical protein
MTLPIWSLAATTWYGDPNDVERLRRIGEAADRIRARRYRSIPRR